MNFNDELKDITTKFDLLKHTKQFKEEEKVRLTKELENLSNERVLLKKSDAVFESLIKILNDQSIQVVERLVSDGLTNIFEKPFEFKIKIGQKRGNMAFEPYLYEEGQEVDIMNSKGGGAIAIISVLLRIVSITVLGLERVLLLDESLSHLSNQYVDRAAEFLKKIGTELDFTIIMVTHDENFIKHADAVYEVRKDGPKARVVEL